MIDLDAWLDVNNPVEGAKWTLSYGSGINDNGLIAGQGYYDDGTGGLSDGYRAFLLDASSLLPPDLPGDFNFDGNVDAADYVVWRKTDGSQAGYDAWRGNFGASLGPGSGSALPFTEPLSAAVPEPATLLPIIFMAAVVLARQRRSTSQVSILVNA
jgi:hypothetical protein